MKWLMNLSKIGVPDKLLERYEHLKKVTLENLPNLWLGLEFALSVKTILNIKGCTFPFAGILLGPASSQKTLIIECFRGSRNTFYTDNFTPKSLVLTYRVRLRNN